MPQLSQGHVRTSIAIHDEMQTPVIGKGPHKKRGAQTHQNWGTAVDLPEPKLEINSSKQGFPSKGYS